MSDASPQNSQWTVGKLLIWTAEHFHKKEVEGGRLAAELLLAHAMGCRKIELYTRFETTPPDEQRNAFRQLVKQAVDHTPIAYLLGSREFFSLEFKVTPAVLIPRPETEVIVQRVIDICRAEPQRTWHILDVGTGSGCIAIAIAHYATNAQILASDISEDALAIAQENVDRHQHAGRVTCICADGVNIPAESKPDTGFDIIVSNPPYISREHYETLPPHIRNHEPALALTGVEGNSHDGLDLYRHLAEHAPSILAPQGRLITEFGFDQHTRVRDIFANTTHNWTHIATHRDPTDPHDRAAEFQLNA